ncbi:MAG: FtsW/RodA/SpoVE family cell cycle protein, partial [Endomicrobium sp.]|nr:FtsW/RodA/SpoVE family cell cycle protein [Endomicrobium sp.]
NAGDDFAQYLALGITVTIVFQALINMSMAIGIMPTKGMPLPFISLGGTSLIITMAASGVLINISKKQ